MYTIRSEREILEHCGERLIERVSATTKEQDIGTVFAGCKTDLRVGVVGLFISSALSNP